MLTVILGFCGCTTNCVEFVQDGWALAGMADTSVIPVIPDAVASTAATVKAIRRIFRSLHEVPPGGRHPAPVQVLAPPGSG
jgi:hypothetical protein